MIYTVSQISQSLGTYLAEYFPDVTFYEDPLAQGVVQPAMFLQTRNASIKKGIGEYYLWTLRLDLVYLIPMNAKGQQEAYSAAAEILDIVMDTFPYIAPDGSTAKVHAENRSWTIDYNELHYKFDVSTRVSKTDLGELMRALELNLEVKDGTEKI